MERKSLERAREELEDLSRQMHDEVSETENIRKNLAIERMIEEGCDILLDVNQMFVRQGTLLEVLLDRPRREEVRQCFLFSNHLIVPTRTQEGRLHLVDGVGKISLAEVSLTEDLGEDSPSLKSVSSLSEARQQDYHG